MSESNAEVSTGSASPARKEPHHLRTVVIIWAVLSVIGIVLWITLGPLILPASAGSLSSTDHLTFIVLSALAVPVGMFVWVFLGYSLFAFRVRERPTEDGVALQPRPALQIGWLSITGALCLFLLIWGFTAFYLETSASASNTLVVQVTGQQWAWTFQYRDSTGTWIPSHGQVLELPVNRPVQFIVTSEDVLHGFAIPSLGVRVDANPGEVTMTPLLTPTQMGNYSVYCVELCGLYHSYMWSAVKVVDQSTFNAYITSLGGHP